MYYMLQGCQIDNTASPPKVYKIGAYDQVDFSVDINHNVVLIYNGGDDSRYSYSIFK